MLTVEAPVEAVRGRAPERLLDGGAGEVVDGLDVVKKIGVTPTRNDKPVTPVVIESLKITRD